MNISFEQMVPKEHWDDGNPNTRTMRAYLPEISYIIAQAITLVPERSGASYFHPVSEENIRWQFEKLVLPKLTELLDKVSDGDKFSIVLVVGLLTQTFTHARLALYEFQQDTYPASIRAASTISLLFLGENIDNLDLDVLIIASQKRLLYFPHSFSERVLDQITPVFSKNEDLARAFFHSADNYKSAACSHDIDIALANAGFWNMELFGRLEGSIIIGTLSLKKQQGKNNVLKREIILVKQGLLRLVETNQEALDAIVEGITNKGNSTEIKEIYLDILLSADPERTTTNIVSKLQELEKFFNHFLGITYLLDDPNFPSFDADIEYEPSLVELIRAYLDKQS